MKFIARIFALSLSIIFAGFAFGQDIKLSEGKDAYQNNRFAESIPLLDAECKADNFDSCYTLAIIKSNTELGFLDDIAAFGLYKRACDGKYWEACRELGFMYETGTGIAQNNDEALDLYYLACENKDGFACMTAYDLLKIIWSQIPEDFNQNLLNQYAKKGCDNEYPQACYEWGMINLKGIGIAADIKAAKAIFEKGVKLDCYDCKWELENINKAKQK